MSLYYKLLFAIACITPALSQATVVDLNSNNFTTPVNSASWTSGDGVTFTMESSLVGLDSGGNGIHMNDTTSNNSHITLTFSEAISSLKFRVSDIDNTADGFANFSILPSMVDGNYYITGAGAVVSHINNGNGYLYWNTLSTDTLSFDWVRGWNLGIGISEIEYEVAASAVSAPGSTLLLFASILDFAGSRRVSA